MQGNQVRRGILVPCGVLFLAMLACGGFQVRVTPSPQAASTVAAAPTTTSAPSAPSPTVAPTRAPTALASPTATQTATGGLASGQSARVSASGGVNVREQASASAKLLGNLKPNAVVTIRSGPAQADNFTWWEIDDGAGLVGWVSGGTKEDPWLTLDTSSGPAAGGGKLANRPIRLGDRVQVTMPEGKALTVREAAGKGAASVALALPGWMFTVRGGPVSQDDLQWWQLEGEKIKGWAAEGQEGERWLTPVDQ
jgi:hypothetical protein